MAASKILGEDTVAVNPSTGGTNGVAAGDGEKGKEVIY